MTYKNLTILLLVIVVAVIITWQWPSAPAEPDLIVVEPPVDMIDDESDNSNPDESPAEPAVLVSNLEIPWDIAFLPNNNLLVTERSGRLLHLAADGSRTLIHDESVVTRGEGGLLGVTLHPQFATNQFIYLYFSAPGSSGNTENRVERYKLKSDKLTDKQVIVSGIPGAIYHDGGRMEFGPRDGLLYITTGDATTPRIAQDLNSLGGKILRLKDDGTIPADNPFVSRGGKAAMVYSYGHRNPQGLAWDSAGQLWSTEHGRSGVTSGLDEINLIKPGANYGWPESEGDNVEPGTVTPALHSGSADTWAPASLVYLNGSLFFGGLRGEALYEAVLAGDKVVELKTHLYQEYGRIRTVRVGPDGFLYLTTSNRDGRGQVKTGDDKIIKLDPRGL